MLAYQQSGMSGDFGRYSTKYIAAPKSPSSCRDSVISVTTHSTKSIPSRYARSSTVSSQTSVSSVASNKSEQAKRYRFDTAPKLVKTPWEADRSKRTFSRQWQPATLSASRPTTAKSNYLPPYVFRQLPQEVYECIVAQLAMVHLNNPSGACLSCYLADLSSLCLTSRAWALSSRRKLYEDIWIPLDDPSQRPAKTPPFLRMKQLRKTLRDRPSLAMLVKGLNVPGMQTLYKLLPTEDQEAAVSVMASLVMTCPNLEQFSGLYTIFDHDYDRLTHALSTRPYLKSKTWILKQIEERYDMNGNLLTNARPVEYDGSVVNGDAFLNSHALWRNLETLILFGQDTGNLDYRAFVATFRTLPSLKHLLISGFDEKQFNDRTLAALPLDLRSLRLQTLPGITERGLLRLTNSPNMSSMRNLSLIGLEISSARLISRVLATTPQLRQFTLIQSMSPAFPSGSAATSPIYASKSLRFLHWDVSPFSQPSVDHIALAIRTGAFPSLRAVRVPCDDGSIQALCRPRAQIAQRSDMDVNPSLSLRTSLAIARMMAQERLEEARQLPYMRVVVTDEFGIIQHKYTIKNYLGDVTSKIEYVLDGGSTDKRDDSGVLELSDLLGSARAASSGGYRLKGGSWCESIHQEAAVHGNKTMQAKSTRTHRPRERIKHVDTQAFFGADYIQAI